MFQRTLVLFCLALMVTTGLAATALAQSQSRFFHIRVTDDYDDEERMSINFPLSMVKGFLPMIEREHMKSDGDIMVEGWNIEFDDVKYMVQGLRETKEGEYLTIETDDGAVEAGKEEGFLVIRAKPHRKWRHADFDARIPLNVIYAAVPEDGERLDLRAALTALSEGDAGDLITLRDGDVRINCWVDDRSE